MDTKGLIQTFNHSEFGQLRVCDLSGKLWFISQEITKTLGYLNNSKAIKDNVDEEDVTISYIPELSNNYTLINESGLYSLILRSNKPKAKFFKRWVTSEVLPSIRKHGVYKEESKDELTEESFIEYDGSFWLDTEIISQQLRYMGFEEPTDHIEISYDNHKDFLANYFAKIKGQDCFRDYGIVYLLLIISVEVSKKKEEIQNLCARIEVLLEYLKSKSTNHIKISAVKAYQEVVSKITASGNDVGFIGNLIRYKRKELTTSEIAILTGQKEDDVAVYLEELEASGIMDMADLLEGAVSNAICLPPAPLKKVENEPLFNVSKELVQSLGFNEAMVLHQLQTMIAKENKGYIHITYKEWLRRFPFKSEETLMRIVRKLENMGIIESKIVVVSFQRIKKYNINQNILHQNTKTRISS